MDKLGALKSRLLWYGQVRPQLFRPNNQPLLIADRSVVKTRSRRPFKSNWNNPMPPRKSVERRRRRNPRAPTMDASRPIMTTFHHYSVPWLCLTGLLDQIILVSSHPIFPIKLFLSNAIVAVGLEVQPQMEMGKTVLTTPSQ